MASSSTPTHGKLANVYRWRSGGFIGAGLNDLTWATAYAGAATAFYEVEIDATGTPDTFKWRKDAGSYTASVAITGAAQTLNSSQQITFAATTGHTVGDEWTIGNFKDEACTESSATAQITTATRRYLNPNAPPTFTDASGANVLTINYTNGTAVFDTAAGQVDVDGNLGWIPSASLEKVGYLIGWSADFTVDMGNANRCGQHWMEYIPGQASGTGTCDAFFIGGDNFLEMLTDAADGTNEYCLLELFSWDPDQDQTGDRFIVWATFNGLGYDPNVGDMVRDALTFQTYGMPSFTANS